MRAFANGALGLLAGAIGGVVLALILLGMAVQDTGDWMRERHHAPTQATRP